MAERTAEQRDPRREVDALLTALARRTAAHPASAGGHPTAISSAFPPHGPEPAPSPALPPALVATSAFADIASHTSLRSADRTPHLLVGFPHRRHHPTDRWLHRVRPFLRRIRARTTRRSWCLASLRTYTPCSHSTIVQPSSDNSRASTRSFFWLFSEIRCSLRGLATITSCPIHSSNCATQHVCVPVYSTINCRSPSHSLPTAPASPARWCYTPYITTTQYALLRSPRSKPITGGGGTGLLTLSPK